MRCIIIRGRKEGRRIWYMSISGLVVGGGCQKEGEKKRKQRLGNFPVVKFRAKPFIIFRSVPDVPSRSWVKRQNRSRLFLFSFVFLLANAWMVLPHLVQERSHTHRHTQREREKERMKERDIHILAHQLRTAVNSNSFVFRAYSSRVFGPHEPVPNP